MVSTCQLSEEAMTLSLESSAGLVAESKMRGLMAVRQNLVNYTTVLLFIGSTDVHRTSCPGIRRPRARPPRARRGGVA